MIIQITPALPNTFITFTVYEKVEDFSGDNVITEFSKPVYCWALMHDGTVQGLIQSCDGGWHEPHLILATQYVNPETNNANYRYTIGGKP